MSSLFGDVVNHAVKGIFTGAVPHSTNCEHGMNDADRAALHKNSWRASVTKMQEEFINETGHVHPGDENVVFDESSYDLEPISDVELFEKQCKLPPSIATPSHASLIVPRRALIVYNPASGSHAGEKIAQKCEQLLKAGGCEATLIRLERRGHAEEIIRDYDFTHIDVVGCIGGDGTFHEAINGMMKRKEGAHKAPLAFISGGTGNSFSLELQGGTQISRSVKHILRGLTCPIDVGQVTFPKEDGTEEVIYSFNSMHWGLASKVNVTAEKLRWIGKAFRYTTAAFLELVRGDTTRAKIVLETPEGHVETYDENFCLIICNNIVSAAKGMKMAPFAKINDGLFDLLIIRSSKTTDLMQVFRKVYDGTHINSKEVEYRQVKSYSVIPFKKEDPNKINKEEDPDIAEEIVDIDGELKGATPFFCKVLPRAIRVIV